MWKTSLNVLLKESATATPTFSNQYPDQSAAINTEVRPSVSKKIKTHWRLRWWLASFSNKVFLNYGMYIVFFKHNVIAHLVNYSIV